MEILQSPPHISNPNWLVDQAMPSKWTQYENKLFENALAVYDKDTPDRWARVAAMIPGKTVWDVMNQYRELEEDVCNIEAGLIPIPGYVTPKPSQFTFDWDNTYGYDYGFRAYSARRRTPEQERKKGVPWTEDEHKLFLLGLKKYGKGDWRNISRNFVVSRTPTQVASHAQKFFMRQLSGAKYKRRASIHDITTVNLSETARTTPSPSPSSPFSSEINNNRFNSNSIVTTNQAHFQWNQPNAGVAMGFNPCYGVKLQAQNLQTSALHEASYLAHQIQNLKFQTQHLPHA